MSRAAWSARVITCVAGLVVGAVAGFVIVDPSSDFAVSWLEPGPDSWDGWRMLVGIAPGVAVVVAALAALTLTRTRRAWMVAAAAFAGVLIVSGPVLDQVIPQLAQRYSVAGLAGLALGGAAAALWPRRGGATCLVIGAAGGLLLSSVVAEAVAYQALPRRLAEYIEDDVVVAPWWWLLAASAVALAAAIVGDDVATGTAAATALDRRTIAAAALIAVGGAVSYVLADSDATSLVVALVSLALALAVFAAAAWLLPGLDGRLLLAVLAVSAVAAPLLLQVVSQAILDAPILALAAALIGAGGYLGWRFPLPAFGLAGVFAVAALDVPVVGDPTTLAVIRLLLLALAAGQLVASTLPDRAASGAVGAAALFMPFAWSALSMGTLDMGWVAYTPLTDAPLGSAGLEEDSWSTGGDGAFLSNVEFTFPALTPGGLSAAMAVLVLVAGIGMSALSRRRV